MILIDQAAETTRTSPDAELFTLKGKPTVIILERDGSLRHYPPDRPGGAHSRARIDISEDQAQPRLLERILEFTFDVLGFNSLEVRVNEHPKR